MEQTVPTYDLVVVPINAESVNRIMECEAYIPFQQRPVSCTETCARVLGYITQGTFELFAQAQVNPHSPHQHSPANRDAIEACLSYSNNAQVRLHPVNLDNAYALLGTNMAAMLCSSRPTGFGHTMIIARNEFDQLTLIDPGTGMIYVGVQEIQTYLQSENLTIHSVPVVISGTLINVIPFGGGGKCIMVNIPKTQDMYAMLGMVADKTFSRLVNKSSVPLILVSIDLESTLHKMASNKATLIYGDGHTMILLKKSRLELIDPVANKKLVGYSEIMKYLSTFTKIMTLYNTNGSKSRTFKSKPKSRKSRTFKSH
jgi:hypothetical protein